MKPIGALRDRHQRNEHEESKCVSTPTVPEPSEAENSRLSSLDMTKDEASRFRGLVARANHFKSGTDPTCSSRQRQPWPKIKRIARYLVKASQAVQKFAWQEKLTQITTYVDSDWAGNKITRKSTSGGAMFLGMKSWSSTL